MARAHWSGPETRWVLTSGIPRAGTSWIHRIVWHLVSDAGVAVRDRFDSDGSRLDDFPTNATGDVEDLRMRAALDAWRTGGSGVRVSKTHYYPGSSLTEGPRFRVVWMWRDLRDVLASTCHFALSGPAADVFGAMEPDEAYVRVAEMTVPVQVAVLRHLVEKQLPESTLVLEYSRVSADLEGAVQRIGQHIGVSIDDASEVADAHRFDAESGRQAGDEDRSSYHRMGAVGGWRETLPAVAHEVIELVAPDLDELQERMWNKYPG